MKAIKLLTLLAFGTAGALVIRRLTASAPAPDAPMPTPPPHVPVVERVLHEHEGEETPMVHAFEQALEEERRHEEQSAGAAGVRA